jgi:hypothetical protein
MWSKDLHNLTLTPLPFAAETIELAQQYDIPNVLHRAYYEILRTPGMIQLPERQSDESEGNQKGETGDSALQIEQPEEKLEPDVYPLFAAQLHRLVSIREQLTECWATFAATPPKSPSCAYKCLIKVYEHWTEMVHRSGLYMRYMYDPICGLDALANIDWDGRIQCILCRTALKGVWALRRQILWEMLEVWLMTGVDDGIAQYDVPRQATLYVGSRRTQ